MAVQSYVLSVGAPAITREVRTSVLTGSEQNVIDIGEDGALSLSLVTPPQHGVVRSLETGRTTGQVKVAKAEGLRQGWLYTPAAGYVGQDQFTYLSTDARGVVSTVAVTVHVMPQLADPSQDRDVRGLLGAQAEVARRSAGTQIDLFSRRMESLHGDGYGRSGVDLSLTLAGTPIPSGANASTSPQGNAPSFWMGGALVWGTHDATARQRDRRFRTDGVSMGVDYRLSDLASVGMGAGFGYDKTDVGDLGSQLKSQYRVLAGYAVLRPLEKFSIDGVIGYGQLRFDQQRVVADGGGDARGHRNGTQWFGSLAAAYDYRTSEWLVSPYGRFEVMSADLGAFQETAAQSRNALAFERQTVYSQTFRAGVRGERRWYLGGQTFVPGIRAEYLRHFESTDDAFIRYADSGMNGLRYRLTSDTSGNEESVLELACRWLVRRDATISMTYGRLFGSAVSSQSLRLSAGLRF